MLIARAVVGKGGWISAAVSLPCVAKYSEDLSRCPRENGSRATHMAKKNLSVPVDDELRRQVAHAASADHRPVATWLRLVIADAVQSAARKSAPAQQAQEARAVMISLNNLQLLTTAEVDRTLGLLAICADRETARRALDEIAAGLASIASAKADLERLEGALAKEQIQLDAARQEIKERSAELKVHSEQQAERDTELDVSATEIAAGRRLRAADRQKLENEKATFERARADFRAAAARAAA
jgi:hypothetical protein